MLLSIKRDTLLKPLQMTTGFVEKKQTMPILSNVYLKKTGDEITIIANDMEIQASVVTRGEMTGDDFAITLPAKKLQDVLKVFPEDKDIKFSCNDSKVSVTCGRTKFSLQSLPAEHYPLLKVTDELIGQFSLGQGTFKKLISQVQYAMADKDSRVFLNGMLLEIKNGQLRLVATDAHRLGFATCQLNDTIANCSSIIPRKTILELYRLLEEESAEDIIVKIYPSQVYFETSNKQLITKVIDGKYPDYERVIPLGNNKLCLINRLELLSAVERVAVIGIDKLKTITFDITPEHMHISCRNEEQEESSDEIDIIYQAEETLRVNFNISYIRDILTTCSAENLQWAFFDAQRSVLVTVPNDNDFKAVIMPLRT